MNRATIVAVVGCALLVTGCGGGTTPAAEPTVAASTPPSPVTAATTSSEPGDVNLAAGFNDAWVRLTQAQKAYDALGSVESLDKGSVNRAWIDDMAAKLADVRAEWQTMKTAADALPLPQTFTTKGVMSRPTVDEYMAAYDAFLTEQEATTRQVIECVDEGGTAYRCAMTSGLSMITNDTYLAAWQRLVDATYAVFDEANQPTN